MRVLKKIGSIALDVLIVFILLLSIVMIIANASSAPGEPPSLFGCIFSSVQTDSMEPTIKVGDMIVGVQPDEDTVIEVGDIISFYDRVDGQRIIKTHRVVEVEQVGNDFFYTTRGDNAPDEDFGTRLGTEVVAIYKFRLPALGAIIDFFRKPVGFVLCLVLPMVALIGWQVYRLIAIYLKEKRAEVLEGGEDGLTAEQRQAIIDQYLEQQRKEAEPTEPLAPAEEPSAEGEAADPLAPAEEQPAAAEAAAPLAPLSEGSCRGEAETEGFNPIPPDGVLPLSGEASEAVEAQALPPTGEASEAAEAAAPLAPLSEGSCRGEAETEGLTAAAEKPAAEKPAEEQATPSPEEKKE